MTEELLEEFHVVIHCPQCGTPAEAWLLEAPRFDPASPHTPIDLDLDVDCETCGNSFSVTVRAYADEWDAFLTDDNSQKGTFEHFDYRPDQDPFPEPGSYGIFLEALEEWRFNVTDLGEANGESSRNRMLFTTLYSIVEAYLSDTIIGAALADTAVQRHMLKLDGLKGTVVSLETVLDKPNIVRDLVKTTLQGMSFHNLTAVNGITKVAFGKPILPSDNDDRALVMKSIDKRHDCVHRNGNDNDGNKHTDITQDYLRQLGAIFEIMVDTLENAMTDAKVARFFENLEPEPEEKGVA